MKKFYKNLLLVLIIFSCFQGFLLIRPRPSSSSLTSVSDLLSTSRLSYFARQSGTLAGGSIIKVNTTAGLNPDNSSANLFPGDSLAIGNGGTITTYTVNDILDDDEIELTAAIGSDDDDDGDVIIATRSASHTVAFTTATAITNGALRIRIKADSTWNNNDGLPDPDGFDFGVSSPVVTCPGDIANYDFVAGTATASGGTGCSAGWHCFECRYSGSGAVGTVFGSGGDSDAITIASLINPAPASGHTAGSADTYMVHVEHLAGPQAPSPYSTVDTTPIKIAVVESVRVTATVDPSIVFTIAGVTADSGAYCGVTRTASSVDSTATSVPFSSLSLAAFNDAQQQLSCVTNALNGYAVTIISDDQLSIGGDHSTEILNTDCDSENCTDTTSAEWSTENDTSGFGFSIQNIDANSVPFQYSTATGLCTGTYCARMIPSTATAGESGTTDDSDTALTIMYNSSTPTTTEDAYMCYRLTISTVQPAGDYENNLTYVATATF